MLFLSIYVNLVKIPICKGVFFCTGFVYWSQMWTGKNLRDKMDGFIKIDPLICNNFMTCSPLCSSVVKIGTAFPYTRVRKFKTTRVWTPLGVSSIKKVVYPKTQLNLVHM